LFGAERAPFEFMIKPGRARCASTSARCACCRSTSSAAQGRAGDARGQLRLGRLGARWDISRKGEHWQAAVKRTIGRRRPGWPVRGVDADTIETEMPGSWISATQLAIWCATARPHRGHRVSTGRIKKMRFERAA